MREQFAGRRGGGQNPKSPQKNTKATREGKIIGAKLWNENLALCLRQNPGKIQWSDGRCFSPSSRQGGLALISAVWKVGAD